MVCRIWTYPVNTKQGRKMFLDAEDFTHYFVKGQISESDFTGDATEWEIANNRSLRSSPMYVNDP
jgi:hypothetical protein